MQNPATALLIFAAISAGVALLTWPRRGLLVRLYRLIRLTERVRIEDALKHLHNQEYLGKPASIETVAGALETSRARAVKLLAGLESRGLVRSDGSGLPLTDAGRAYARRVIRSHRLWERYLADLTSVKPGDWHDAAELREHTLTPDAVAELDARMGHPRYDPHGDPIPTESGELPPQSGVPLTALEAGQSGTIIHLEDEPREVYDQLAAAGLAPLMELQVLEATPSSLRFTADGSELTLVPVVASNITVQPRPTGAVASGSSTTLAQLRPGEAAKVVRISPLCRGAQRRRLLDLGVVPGTVVSAELEGAMRDPVAYEIRGALIALRRHQAEWIYVETPSGDSTN
jgi:DtxR family Mn-dependent transcriptional regulator